MKKLLSIILCLIIASITIPLTAFADGDGNIDNGGGGMGDGTSGNYWNPGMDGVRVTVINTETQKPVTTPIDLTNKKPTVQIHFGKVSKIHYRNGQSLSATASNYSYENPSITLPTIINSNSGQVNIDTIKAYFCSEYVVKGIAASTGLSYNSLISGKYKLLLEPIAYFTYSGIKYANDRS